MAACNERVKFFGIKMINNTGTIDEIPGSRMLTSIRTRRCPRARLCLESFCRAPRERAQLRDQFTRHLSGSDAHAQTYAAIFRTGQRERTKSRPRYVIAESAVT